MKKELDEKLLGRFRTWCLRRYTERTTTKYVGDVRALVRYGGEPPQAQKRISRLRDYRLAWDVWSDWGEGGKLPVARPDVPDTSKLRGGRRAREPKRLREAVSFERKDYDRLCALAERSSSDPAVLVLLVIARTGLRVCDVLRAPVGSIRKALRRADGIVTIVVKGEKPSIYSVRGGGASERAWRALMDNPVIAKAPDEWHVAAAMMEDPKAKAEAGHGAYERVRVRLLRLGTEAEVVGRLHLHRFRRSVAVYLLNAGASIEQTQRALIHTSPEQTREYADESRALDTAKLLSKIE